MISDMFKRLATLLFLLPTLCFGNMALRDNLAKASPGDFIVTAQNKTYTVLLIQGREGNNLRLEEITVPITRMNLKGFSWRDWIAKGAPGNTAWVRYTIDLNDASMQEFYSFTRKGYFKIDEANNFLSKLLNLQLQEIPHSQRKKIGTRPPIGADNRRLWQPQMVIDGNYVSGVRFAAYRTQWPKDGTELSGKSIEVYVPEENSKYPSYFPYWLQVYGAVGKAKIRIVDSGINLRSPQPEKPDL